MEPDGGLVDFRDRGWILLDGRRHVRVRCEYYKQLQGVGGFGCLVLRR